MSRGTPWVGGRRIDRRGWVVEPAGSRRRVDRTADRCPRRRRDAVVQRAAGSSGTDRSTWASCSPAVGRPGSSPAPQVVRDDGRASEAEQVVVDVEAVVAVLDDLGQRARREATLLRMGRVHRSADELVGDPIAVIVLASDVLEPGEMTDLVGERLGADEVPVRAGPGDRVHVDPGRLVVAAGHAAPSESAMSCRPVRRRTRACPTSRTGRDTGRGSSSVSRTLVVRVRARVDECRCAVDVHPRPGPRPGQLGHAAVADSRSRRP